MDFKSEKPQSLELHYIRDLQWDVWASRHTIETLPLFDDGNHDDLEGGDLIYGNNLTFVDKDSGLVPFCFKGSDFYYPTNGLFYINCFRTNTFALNINRNIKNFNQQLRFGKVHKNGDEYFVEMINSGSKNVNLSYCYLQLHLFPK